VPSDSDTPRFAWSDSQRRVLLVLLGLLFAFLLTRYACNTMYVSDPQPEMPLRYHELADRIDPNTVDWQTLAALPGIGERRARDIVEYRERKRAEARDPALVVFDGPGDLLYIRGIGPALIEAMQPHLLFPSPSSQPANRSATTSAL
jgi:hypothetical protein